MQQSQQEIVSDLVDWSVSLGLTSHKETQGLGGLILERLATCMSKAVVRVVPSFSMSFENVIPSLFPDGHVDRFFMFFSSSKAQ